MKKIVGTLLLNLIVLMGYACDGSSASIESIADNGDGTYTLVIDICVEFQDPEGDPNAWAISFNDALNVVSATPAVVTTSANNDYALSVSGAGAVWTFSGLSPSNVGPLCFTATLIVDALPITSVDVVTNVNRAGTSPDCTINLPVPPLCSISGLTAAVPSACNPVDNSYTVAITVTYTDPPTTGTLDINGESFPITPSPQTVTLTNGLIAFGGPVAINASFSEDPGCTITVGALYTSPDACCSISGLSAGLRTVCDASALTYGQEVIVTYSDEPTGDLVVNGQTFSITSSPQTVNLIGLVVDGNAVDVTAQFTVEPSCTATSVSLFESEVVSEPIFSSINCINGLTDLPTTSSDGITGLWSVKSIAEPTVYIFTPDLGFCADSTSLTLPFCRELLIPNVFTPNGDGENDGFTITSDKLTSLDVVIYNRWGQVVFSWTSLNGSWDGRTISGIASPEGTYFYIAKVVGVDGEESTQKGTFSLLR
jgi:gliding motility-associated-like protein